MSLICIYLITGCGIRLDPILPEFFCSPNLLSIIFRQPHNSINAGIDILEFFSRPFMVTTLKISYFSFYSITPYTFYIKWPYYPNDDLQI